MFYIFMWLFTSFTILYHLTLNRIFLFSLRKMGGKTLILLVYGIYFTHYVITIIDLTLYMFFEYFTYTYFCTLFIWVFHDGWPLRFTKSQIYLYWNTRRKSDGFLSTERFSGFGSPILSDLINWKQPWFSPPQIRLVYHDP